MQQPSKNAHQCDSLTVSFSSTTLKSILQAGQSFQFWSTASYQPQISKLQSQQKHTHTHTADSYKLHIIWAPETNTNTMYCVRSANFFFYIKWGSKSFWHPSLHILQAGLGHSDLPRATATSTLHWVCKPNIWRFFTSAGMYNHN